MFFPMIQNFMKKSYPRLHEFYMHIEEKYREQKKKYFRV